jgi:alpha-galactosidase
MDAERIARNSRVALSYPDWVGAAYDGEKRLSDVLDLTNPAAAKWMEDQIAGVIDTNGCDYFRLDYNVAGMKEGIRTVRDGYVENGYWRYYEALYAIYDRLRARYPNVIFESCAGGGGRTDIGMVRRFSHQVTDCAPRVAITNGMVALPRVNGSAGGRSNGPFDGWYDFGGAF